MYKDCFLDFPGYKSEKQKIVNDDPLPDKATFIGI